MNECSEKVKYNNTDADACADADIVPNTHNEAGLTERDFLELIGYLRRCSASLARNECPDKLFKRFCERISNNVGFYLSYNKTCPLLIVTTGFWSSFYKRERNYIENIQTLKVQRLFFERCLKELLHKGSDINMRHQHRHKSTAMHWLIAWDRPFEGVKFIEIARNVGATINFNSTDAYDRTVLSLLVARKYFGRNSSNTQEDDLLIEVLIANKTDLAQQDQFGNTALHYACLKKDKTSMHRILEASMDKKTLWRIRNNQGHTPADVCMLSYKHTAELIRAAYNSSKAEHMLCEQRWLACDFIKEIQACLREIYA